MPGPNIPSEEEELVVNSILIWDETWDEHLKAHWDVF